MKAIKFLSGLVLVALFYACTDPNAPQSVAKVDQYGLYVPTTSDVTSSASLQDLQTGKALYINNCASCHQLYLPDNYPSAQWNSIMMSMAPRTSLTSSQVALVTKYLTRGK